MRHDLKDATVVITGASAGVGRATARRFARQGARVCLIARDSDGLRDAEAEVKAIGGRALAIPADVADADAVFAAADECERQLGPIEVWVNNAMNTVFSPVAELRPEEVRRVTEVTYLGYVHGTLAALRHMRARDRGVIVQVGSALAYRSIPLQAPYCAAKAAIRGFTDSLRCELLRERSGIAITAVHLPAVNTPQFDWARTHMGHEPRPVPPVYTASVAARAITHAASYPEREYWLGWMTPILILASMLIPGMLDRHLADSAWRGQATNRPAEPDRRDNLASPVDGLHRTDGSFGAESANTSMLISPRLARTAAVVGTCLVTGIAGAAIGRMLSGRTGSGPG